MQAVCFVVLHKTRESICFLPGTTSRGSGSGDPHHRISIMCSGYGTIFAGCQAKVHLSADFDHARPSIILMNDGTHAPSFQQMHASLIAGATGDDFGRASRVSP